MGNNSIALGNYAGQTRQSDNSIVLNASTDALKGTSQSLFVNPIRYTNNSTESRYPLYYNETTKEVTYQQSVVTTVNQSAFGETKKVSGVLYKHPTTISEKNIIASINNTVSTNQTYTFGERQTNLSVIVGAGVSHTMAYSVNDTDWIGLGTSIFSISGKDVYWKGDIWDAVVEGSSNTLAYSFNGISWVGLSKSLFSIRGNGVCCNNDVWISVGAGVSKIGFSYNGLIWTSASTTIFSYGNKVCWK
jgi:hypothetical protein